MIKPLNGYVLVEVIREEDALQKEGGVLLPESHNKTDVGIGAVIELSEELPLQIGDRIMFDTALLTKVRRGKDELNFVRFDDILGYERIS